MAHADAFSLQNSELNRFLFADVGIERNGSSLTVLSLLARLNRDPWREAGRLAKLPEAEASDSLARIIATMPASMWRLPEAAVIATRLVDLLPRHTAIPPILQAPRRKLAARLPAGINVALSAAIGAGIVVALIAAWFL